jgi:hypothetical protein
MNADVIEMCSNAILYSMALIDHHAGCVFKADGSACIKSNHFNRAAKLYVMICHYHKTPSYRHSNATALVNFYVWLS